MPRYTALVTLLTIAFYFFLATRVAAAHGKFNVKLPAMAGNPDFERALGWRLKLYSHRRTRVL
jgi:glutathione S-transferase